METKPECDDATPLKRSDWSEKLLTFPDAPKPPERPWKRVANQRGGYDFQGLTQETLDAYKATWREYEQAWRAWTATCNDTAAAAARLLIADGFPKERHVSARGHRRVEPLNTTLRSFGPSGSPSSLWLSDEEQWLRLEGTRRRAKEQEEAATALRDRAVTWLMALNKTYGADFTADTASQVALDLAAKEVIARQIGRWNGFSGQNCEGSCRGWDGKSHRCECGNRRVSWMIDGTFEKPCVWGEAY